MNYQKESTPITVYIDFEGQRIPFQCDINEKLENLAGKFSSKMDIDTNSFVFLHGGIALNDGDFKKTFKDIMNGPDKDQKKVNMVAIKIEPQNTNNHSGNSDINVVLIIENKKAAEFKGKKEEPLKNIIQRANLNMNPEFNKFALNYRSNNIDLNKKFDDIADPADRQNNRLIINVNQNKNLSPNVNTNNNRQVNSNYNVDETTNNLRMNTSFM